MDLVILAAGASLRLGQPKALALIHGIPAIEHLIVAGLEVQPDRVHVITGADHAPIAKFLSSFEGAGSRPIEVTHNPRWALGRSLGIALLMHSVHAESLCIAPVDCPLVRPAVFRTLARTWRNAGSPPRGWLAPCTEGDTQETLDKLPSASPVRGRQFGHPIILGAELLSKWDSDPSPGSLRSLREQATPLLKAPVTDIAILDNLDTPQDLEHLNQRRP